MPTCNHCSESFPDDEEEAYLTHLVDDHRSDLGRIDKRRIEQHPDVELGDEMPTQMAMAAQALILLLGVALTIFIMYIIITRGLHVGAM